MTLRTRSIPARSKRDLSWAWSFAIALAACSGDVNSGGNVIVPGEGPGGAKAGEPGTKAGSRTQDVGGPSGKPGANGGNDGAGAPGAAPDASFTCDEKALPPVEGLRRLTMTQYQNSLRDLMTWALGDASLGSKVMTELAPAVTDVPADVREAVPEDLHGSYRRLDQTLQQEHVDALYGVSVATGAALSTADRLERVAGSCATDADASNDDSCLTDFIQRFGSRVLRHPLDDDEVTFYRSVYGSDSKADPAAYADVIGVLLNAPEFVYFVEHGEDKVAGKAGMYTLGAYELASRLSYQIWQTTPDDELIAAAKDGSLLDDAVYASEVDRLLADPKAKPALDEFFADWVKVEDLPELDAKDADPIFKAFAGNDLPSSTLRQAMIDDVLGLLDYYTWDRPSDVSTLFTTEASFATDDALAKIYGVRAWNGKGKPPTFPKGERPGMLTRALFLATGSANTRPIMKGVFIRKRMLCDDIPPPPPGANAKPPELRDDMTTRQVVEELTQKTGTVCTGCHTTVINPLGFATEDFDALGRFRSEQRLFSAKGKMVGQKPVDTESVPHIIASDATPSSGPADLMSMIASSGKAEACLARNFFRFTYARWDDLATDGCALEAQRQALMNGGTILDLVKAATLTPQFRQRRFS